MGLIVIVFVISIMISGITCEENVKVELTLGVIINANDNIMKKIISAAVEVANIELIDYKYKLRIKTEEITENASFYSVRKACNLLQSGVIAILSLIEPAPSRHISSLCSKFHIPHLVTNCRFPKSLETYSMDLKIFPDCKQYADRLYKYITNVVKWKNMILLSSREDYLLRFESLINQIQSKLIIKHWNNNYFNKSKETMLELSGLKNQYNFLVDISYWQIKDFLIMASVHNMTQPQYNFIFTDWDAGLIDISPYTMNNKVRITTFSIINQTYIDNYKVTGPNIKRIIENCIEIEKASKKFDNSQLTANSATIFDAINVLTKGIIKLSLTDTLKSQSLNCTLDRAWSFGSNFLNAIISTNKLQGVTGIISFNHTKRKTFELTAMDLTENGYLESAYWRKDEFKIKSKKLSMNASVIISEPLRVTTIIDEPYVSYYGHYTNDGFNSSISSWRGYCIELLKMIGYDLGLTFVIHVVADGKYGSRNSTSGQWSGMIGEILTKKADIIVGPMTITNEREKVVDFTTPFLTVGLSILLIRSKSNNLGLFFFFSPFSITVWIFIIIAFFATNFLIFILSNLATNKRKQKYSSFIQRPRTYSATIIAAVWSLCTILIILTYIAKLYIKLTSEDLITSIKNFEDLANQKNVQYGAVKGGSTQQYFKMSNNPTYQKIYSYMQQNPNLMQKTVKDGIDKVSNSNGTYAFIMETSFIKYYLERDCNLVTIDELFISKRFGFAVEQGSELREKLSASILKLQKNHLINNLNDEYISNNAKFVACKSDKIHEPVTIENIGGIFLILGFSLIISACIAIIELYVYFRTTRSNNKITFLQVICNTLKFALCCKTGIIEENTLRNVNENSMERLNILEESNNLSNEKCLMDNSDIPVEQPSTSVNSANIGEST